MATHRPMAMARIPVTVYNEDPERTATPAEWQEVWVALNPQTGEWVLCKRHGWWDEAAKQAHFDVPILSEPRNRRSVTSVTGSGKTLWRRAAAAVGSA